MIATDRNVWSTDKQHLLDDRGMVPAHTDGRRKSAFNPLKSRGNYSAASNNMKLVHWPLMGGLLHLGIISIC